MRNSNEDVLKNPTALTAASREKRDPGGNPRF